jgi:hypothetical protein
MSFDRVCFRKKEKKKRKKKKREFKYLRGSVASATICPIKGGQVQVELRKGVVAALRNRKNR